MKVLAVLLLCAFVAVQGRSAENKNIKSVAALGDAPYLVHLRVAVSTSGLLNSGAGSLIASQWVLTSAKAVENSRFIWLRYGSANVINPEVVTESSTVRQDPAGALALVSIGRHVQTTENIAPIVLGVSVPASATFYGYGKNSDNAAGEVLKYFALSLETVEGSIIASSEDGTTTEFDSGAPLVNDGELVAVLVAAGDDTSAGTFEPVAPHFAWIESETGLVLTPEEVDPEAESEDPLRVQFVN